MCSHEICNSIKCPCDCPDCNDEDCKCQCHLMQSFILSEN